MSAAVFAHTLSVPWPISRADDSIPAPALTLDGQHIVAARQRDPTAFEALVRRHQGAIYNFSLRMLGRADDAADVAQETFVQLFTHLGQLDEREPIAPWLFRVARNRCIDVIRRRRTVPLGMPDDAGESTLAVEPADEEPLPEEMAERTDLQAVLASAIAELSPAYAEVLPSATPATVRSPRSPRFSTSDEGTARVRFHRAKALLHRRLRAGVDQRGLP